jgi:hypothetical protein
MDYKFTKSGKKVAVIGKLNNEQWICQEIFVANGQEFPAGENFVETTLLDKPAETWQTRDNKEKEGYGERLKKEIEQLDRKKEILRRKACAANLINRATEKYQNIDIDQLDTFLAFISGQITHLVIKKWHSYEIQSLLDTVEATETYHYIRSDGLRLVSLFGCSVEGERHDEENDRDRSFRLDWRINQYRDGSGSTWDTVYPCKSLEDAVVLMDKLVAEEEEASDDLIKLKEKYKLQNPSAEKIEALRQKRIGDKKHCIETKRSELKIAENELTKLETI